ncbi:hypothetical protein Dimus_002660 [Dionaea muscipula]
MDVGSWGYHQKKIWGRCDVNSISIGLGANIQDNSLVHVAKSNLSFKVLPTIIGDNDTVQSFMGVQSRMKHSWVWEQLCLTDGVVVEKHAMVAAGALVRLDTRIPTGEVCLQCNCSH